MNPIELTNQHASSFTVRFPPNNSNTIGQTPYPDANSQTNAVEDDFFPLSFTSDLESQPHFNDTTDFGLERIERIRNLEQRIALYRIALEGDWELAIESILPNNNLSLLSASITRDKETALHIAAGAKHIGFVEALLQTICKEQVAKKNRHGNTALCFAAASGVVRIAELMVKKNEDLPLIRGFGDVTPLLMAVSYKCKPMASYLLSVTPLTKLTSQERIELLIATIHSDFFDISLKILEDDPTLATAYDTKITTRQHCMSWLENHPHYSGDRLNFWNSCITLKRISEKEEMKVRARKLVELLWKHVVYELPQKEMLSFIRDPSRLLHDAASVGNVEFLVLPIRRYPDIVWEEDDDGKSIFHVAVENRLEDVFNLIYEIGGLKDFSAKYKTTVKGKYNILHLAAKLAAPNHLNRVSGAAFKCNVNYFGIRKWKR